MSNETVTTTEKAKRTVDTSLLKDLHAQWEKGGKKVVDKKQATALMAAWKKASDAREESEQAFAAAQRAESDAVKAIVLARGSAKLKLGDGTVLVPMSRGATVYFRKESDPSKVDTFG